MPNDPKIEVVVEFLYHNGFTKKFLFFRFCQFLKLGSSDKILATVNVGNPVSRNAQKAIFRQWIEEDNQPKLKWNLDID